MNIVLYIHNVFLKILRLFIFLGKKKERTMKIFRFVTVTTNGKKTHLLLCLQIKLSSR